MNTMERFALINEGNRLISHEGAVLTMQQFTALQRIGFLSQAHSTESMRQRTMNLTWEQSEGIKARLTRYEQEISRLLLFFRSLKVEYVPDAPQTVLIMHKDDTDHAVPYHYLLGMR